ncbi:MAG: pyridoxamine 5'-phosphate oxidase family protein [Pseudomonadota bacterium]
MTLNAFAKQVIERFPLGYVATVTPDGLPSLSPKGTFFVLDDETIAFAEIRSPNTLANLAYLPKTEVNFVDIWLRKGVRVFGSTTVHAKGSDEFDALFPKWRDAFPALAGRINAIIVISAERVKPLSTPPYDDGVTEEEMVALYKQKWGELYP